MKKVFTGMLMLNLLVEAVAASFLIGSPDTLFPEGPAAGITWARNYGFAALAMGSTIFWIWPFRDNYSTVSAVLGIMMTFHTGVTISLALSTTQMGPAFLHGFMAVFTISLYTMRSKWCVKQYRAL
jgi:hypothetical protein